MLSVSYESLGKILEQLQASPEIKASPELAERVKNAALFHRQIAAELRGLLEERQELKKTISELTREPGERVCDQPSQNRFSRYDEMRDLGADPQEVYLAARDDGFDEIEVIKVLRQVFHLSVREAQEAISKAQKELQQHAA